MSTKTGFIFPVVGVSYRQEAVRRCRPGDKVLLRAQPDNPHDPNAIAVYNTDGEQLGFVPAALAARMAGLAAAGTGAQITEVLAGKTWGLRVRVEGSLSANQETRPAAPVAGKSRDAVRRVRAKSGRVLGVYDGMNEGRVVVVREDGQKAEFPAGVVVVDPEPETVAV